MNKVLVIEDDEGIRSNVLDLLEAEGFEGIGAVDGESGVALAVQQLPDLVICDISMPGIDGYEVLEILSMKPTTAAIPFVFLSARAERADVRRGMALGADDYLTKPFTRVELLDAIRVRLQRSQRSRSTPAAAEAPSPTSPQVLTRPPKPGARGEERVVVADPAMQALFGQLERVARGPISVLILGETGVGKEIVAEQIHRASGRRGRFVALNCAALTETLLESELFGHEKGSFTGAVAAKEGLFESADGGTVFLDEVGELPLGTQVKLLRVLEDHKVMRVGGREARKIDTRFISATNRDIEREAAQGGGFRQDLYFRLSGMTFEVPPLRARQADISPLVDSFLASSARAMGRTHVPTLSPEALQVMLSYGWPGNIRELRNVIERAVLLCDGSQVEPEHLPSKLVDGAAPVGARNEPNAEAGEDEGDPRARLLGQLEELDRQRIIGALAQCAGNQSKAAELLGISRRTLVTRLTDYDVPRPRKRV